MLELWAQQASPQPKPGACTKAHGGILFIDEIGELHPMQMNKLLKVLEDRKVLLESAYYNENDPNIPAHIHDIFGNGLPADFRPVGATTRNPEELPPALSVPLPGDIPLQAIGERTYPAHSAYCFGEAEFRNR